MFFLLNSNIMKRVLLKINQHILKEIKDVLVYPGKARNKYINQAIQHHNQVQRRKVLRDKLKKESYAVRENSLVVLKEFENIDYVD